MGKIRIGCQTYTWEMLGDSWKGSVNDMLDIIKESGYAGVEITNTMIGEYYDRPEEFAKALDARNLIFPAMGFVPRYGWTDADRAEEELLLARRGIDFVARFPGCRFELAGGSTDSRSNFKEKFDTMCRVYGEVAAYAAKKNVHVDIHPHSHAGSIIESAREYELLMTGIQATS
jgi:inosose dehydratase